MGRLIEGSQTDFSFGEVDVTLKRADNHPARKAGLRQMVNARILNSGAIQDRPGRTALFLMAAGSSRVEEVTMKAGSTFKLVFGINQLQVVNSVGATVASFQKQGSGSPLPWVETTAGMIVLAQFQMSVYLAFPGMKPQVLTWDGVSAWSLVDFAEAVGAGGQKRTVFYRISPQNVTLQPSAAAGNITVAFSAPIAVAGMAGTRIRYCGRQIQLGALINPSEMSATVIEPLPPGMQIAFSSTSGVFAAGDAVRGSSSGAEGVIVSAPNAQNIVIDGGFSGSFGIGDNLVGASSGATGIVTSVSGPSLSPTLYVTLNTSTAFQTGETITGTNGSGQAGPVSSYLLTVQVLTGTSTTAFFVSGEVIVGPSGNGTSSGVAIIPPQAVSVWDDEVMNAFRGYPASVFVDQFRLGFCNFPALPNGIGWSAINSPTDFFAEDASSPDNSIFELAPNKAQVYFVVPGPEGSEFVFCDNRIYYIPITTTNPLVPGSVGFQLLSGDGAARVQPRTAQEAIVYVNAGKSSIYAIIATGAYNKPFNTKELSEFHQHLFNDIQCIACPNADGTFGERYAYVLNGDGTIAVGKYRAETLVGNQPVIGWGPWSGEGLVLWVSALNADVLFATNYFGRFICEVLDDTRYLDCAVSVNSPLPGFAPPAGQGPLWFAAGQTVTLMDQVTRSMGTYDVDGSGNIIPQGKGGEDLTAISLVAGQQWTMTVEPFAPISQPGQDMHQRTTRRQIADFSVYVINATGFQFSSLFSGTQTASSPPLGTGQQYRRVPSWNQGDDATKPPPLRETVEPFKPLGSTFDPRVAIIKDVPGPLQILEFSIEISI